MHITAATERILILHRNDEVSMFSLIVIKHILFLRLKN